MTRYTHCAAAPFTLDRSYQYEQGSYRNGTLKPSGLWFSVDGDWERWCDENEFALDKRLCVYAVEYQPERVLPVIGAGAIDAVTARYAVRGSRYEINWKYLASDYAGIVIEPYVWERRLDGDSGWYYGWDCASGCIWDLSVITKFELMDIHPAVIAAIQGVQP
jgi:hypothetical protein